MMNTISYARTAGLFGQPADRERLTSTEAYIMLVITEGGLGDMSNNNVGIDT